MNLQEQQKKFDVIKWFDSIRAGKDLCGTYAFCGRCDKDRPYPCARAAYRYGKGYIRLAVIRRRK
ncbi:MAG: hypothetical protein IJV85_04675 [Clostridia bacterium]|nr:hypothetical protein [Clostridia bacterium]